MSEFLEKIVLITGGTVGMGLVTAEFFAKEGAIVYISRRNNESGLKSVNKIKKFGKAFFIQCDISDKNQVKNMIDTIIKNHKKLDFAFNNAGVTVSKHDFLSNSLENDWEKVIQINLTGTYYCMKYEIQEMLKNGAGVIVNNSSIIGLIAMSKQAAYAASKAGVIALTKSAAIDYAQKNIRINTIAAGPIIGGMNNEEKLKANPERTNQKISLIAMHRMGLPEEVANTVLWLCSQKSSFLTGAIIPIDGGFSAGKW